MKKARIKTKILQIVTAIAFAVMFIGAAGADSDDIRIPAAMMIGGGAVVMAVVIHHWRTS